MQDDFVTKSQANEQPIGFLTLVLQFLVDYCDGCHA